MYIRVAQTQWINNKVQKVALHGVAPVTYRKAMLHAKNGFLTQYFEVALEYIFCLCYTMVHMPNTAQWVVVPGFVGVRLHPRAGSNHRDGRSSQNGCSTQDSSTL